MTSRHAKAVLVATVLVATLPACIGILGGCSQTPEPCTQSALDAQITACAEAIYQAPDADKERVHQGCITALDLWKDRCL